MLHARTSDHEEASRSHELSPLVVSGLARRSDERPLDLTVEAGECVVISGRSGCGKSTFLKLIADLIPGIGNVTLGQLRREAVPASTWRRKVIYVASDAGWWTSPVAAHMSDLPAARIFMATLEMREDLLRASPDEISNGERQRLALIRALILEPHFLLLDEPTSALDQTSAGLVEHLLLEAKTRGIGLLVASHDTAQISRLADRHIVMSDTGFLEAAL